MAWTIHTANAGITGPLTTQQVLEELRTGGLSGQEWARCQGQKWRPLQAIDVFRHFCEAERPPPPPRYLGVRLSALCVSVLLAFGVGWVL